MSEPNLVKYMNRLSQKEKAVLLRLVKETPDQEHHFEGTLPFISLKVVIDILNVVGRDGYLSEQWRTYARIAKEILAKLDSVGATCEASANFLMHLNDKKVYRQFGKHPEKGKPLNFLPKERVTVGVKFSLPKKCWVPDDNVLVAPSVALKKRGDLWEVTVKESCRARVETWLMQNCA